MQYGGGYSVGRRHIVNNVGGYSVQMCHTISMEETHHQYNGGYAVQICHIISKEEGVHYGTSKTTQGVVGGCIFLEKNDILQTILQYP